MKHWAPYTPSPSDPWDRRKVGHLYRRAAFGASRAEMDRALADGPDATINRLLTGGPANADYEKTCEFMASERSLPAGAQTRQLSAWWLYRLLQSPHPLREKLCLFWHNHFATSQAKVRNCRLMLGQYQTIHEHALGSFRKLLQAMTIDPAMLIWLDTANSKKDKPNENYARELMELFSLGRGHYREADIREAARAFTGFTVKNGKVEFTERDHDAGAKSVFGRKGSFKAGEVVDLCLEHKACATFLAGKLYRNFVSEVGTPSPDAIEELAAEYAKHKYDTQHIISVMLRSQLFYSKAAYRQRVKSPVEYAVGIVRELEGHVGPLPLAEALDGLGQILFVPPSVKGWDGGPAWLNAQTLLFRQNLGLAMTSTDDNRFGRRCDPARYRAANDAELLEATLALHLQGDVPTASRDKLAAYLAGSKALNAPPFWSAEDVQNHRVRTLTHLVLSLPEYQLC